MVVKKDEDEEEAATTTVEEEAIPNDDYDAKNQGEAHNHC